MSNYDHDVLGTGNPNHPANREELELEVPQDLDEALSYYLEHDDFEHLENAITELINEKHQWLEELTETIKFARAANQHLIANNLCRLREKIKRI